ncbi:MAG: DinB family protein [Dehalococcoidia bacterium]
MRAALLAAIDGLTAEEMTAPVIDGWSVVDHLAHLAYWDELRASDVERISAGFKSAWRMEPGRDDALSAIVHASRHGMSPEQARWEIERTRARLIEALTLANDRALDPSHYGEAALHSQHEAQHAGWIRRVLSAES